MTTLNLFTITTHGWGHLLVAFGACTLYCIGSNRFYRRGVSGLQEFHCHFLLALLITVVEWVLLKAGWILVLLGIFMSIHYPTI